MTRRRTPTVARLALAGVLAVQVAACAPSPADPSVSPARPLAQRHTWGGLCPEGPCVSTLTVDADGSWSWSDEATATHGTLGPRELDRLREAVASSGLRASAGPPAQDVRCDADADGRSVSYGWASPDEGWQVVDSCRQVLDARDPLVTRLEQLAGRLAPR